MEEEKKKKKKVVKKKKATEEKKEEPAAPPPPTRERLAPVHNPAATLFDWFVNAFTLLHEREKGELVTSGAMPAWGRCRRACPTLMTMPDPAEQRAEALKWVVTDFTDSTGSPPQNPPTVDEVGVPLPKADDEEDEPEETAQRKRLDPVHDPATTLQEWFVNAYTLLAERENNEVVTSGATAAWGRCKRAVAGLQSLGLREAAEEALTFLASDFEDRHGMPPREELTLDDVGGGFDLDGGGDTSPKHAPSAHKDPTKVPKGPKGPTRGELLVDSEVWGARRGAADCAEARENVGRVGDLFLAGVTLGWDQHELLSKADLRILAGHRYGLSGRNGTGKTTLMKAIATRALPGLPRHLRVCYVQQELAASESESCLRAVMQFDTERETLLKEQAKLEEAEKGEETAEDYDHAAGADRLANIHERLVEISSHDAEDRARQVLSGLKFTKKMIEGPTASLSGGWRQRLALAQALFIRERLDVLLLDEPTNHLDLSAVMWLEKLIRTDCEGLTVVCVSHDTAFLDGIITDVMHLDGTAKKVEYFAGDHTAWLAMREEKARRNEAQMQAAKKQQEKAMAFLDKQKAEQYSSKRDNKKQKQAIERVKKMEKASIMTGGAPVNQNGRGGAKPGTQLTVGGGLFREDGKKYKLSSGDMPEKVEQLRNDPELRFRFPIGAPVGKDLTPIITYDNVNLGYTGHPVLLKKITACVRAKSRIAIVGLNGMGKTTLLKHLVQAGNSGVEASGGNFSRHSGARVAYIAQHHIDAVSAFKTLSASEYLIKAFGKEMGMGTENESRKHLGSFGMGGAVATRPIQTLSGGQKARLAFAAASLPIDTPPHMLVLDEPTNHLDAEATQALQVGLQDFQGAVVLVSHNRRFITSCCSDLWVVHKGAVTVSHHSEGWQFEEAFNNYCNTLA